MFGTVHCNYSLGSDWAAVAVAVAAAAFDRVVTVVAVVAKSIAGK